MPRSETLAELKAAAESEWLEGWTRGPTDDLGALLPPGSTAPSLDLEDDTCTLFSLSDAWADSSALLMFWRHFGCTCGHERARRLSEELDAYTEAGLRPVIVSQGEPIRAAEYRAKYEIGVPILCDPDQIACRWFGVGHWAVEFVIGSDGVIRLSYRLPVLRGLPRSACSHHRRTTPPDPMIRRSH